MYCTEWIRALSTRTVQTLVRDAERVAVATVAVDELPGRRELAAALSGARRVVVLGPVAKVAVETTGTRSRLSVGRRPDPHQFVFLALQLDLLPVTTLHRREWGCLC